MVVFDGSLHVHYGQAYIVSGDPGDASELDAYFANQTNGLLGAAVPGRLFLITGLHTGHVQFTVEIADSEPPPDPTGEDCVEATFEPQGDVQLIDWDGDVVCAVPLEPQPYRVRYEAFGMDDAHEADTVLEHEP